MKPTTALVLKCPLVSEDPEIQKEHEVFLEQAKKVDDLKVVDKASLAVAAESAVLLSKMEKWLVAKRQVMVKPSKDLVNEIEADFRAFLGPIAEWRAALNKKQADFIAKEEEAAERLRQQQEKLQREEEERRRKAEEELAAKRAKELKKGTAPPVPLELPVQRPALTIPVPEPTKKVVTFSGSSHVRRSWNFEVTDMKAFCKGVVDGVVPAGAILINGSLLKNLAREKDGKVEYPGVRFFQDINMVNK